MPVFLLPPQRSLARKEQAAAIAFTSTANLAAGVDTELFKLAWKGENKGFLVSERLAAFVRVKASLSTGRYQWWLGNGSRYSKGS